MEKKPTKFVLSSDWFLQRPIDMEHKEYVLNSFLSKVEDALGRGEIYPHFTELSLHMASVGNYLKNGKFVEIQKDFNSVDEEIMLYEIKTKKSRKKFTEQENIELKKILINANEKMSHYFSICKAMWDFSYESTSFKLRKNKKNLREKRFYVVFQNEQTKDYYVWEFELKSNPEFPKDTRMFSQLIYCGKDESFTEVIENYSTSKNLTLPIFEVFSSQNLPVDNTLLPLFKRKIHSYLIQSGV